MMPSLIIMQVLSAAALVAAQGPGSSVGVHAPGVNYSSAALQVYRDAAQASKSVPNSSWEVYWKPNIANFTRSIIWDTVISDIPAPVPRSDLGQPNADYSERLNFTNTQVQLRWDTEQQNNTAGLFGNSSIQEILQGASTTLDLDIFTTYLPASALSDYVNLANGSCSWLSPECRDELAAAARRSAPLPSAGPGTGSLPNCTQQLGDVTVTHISFKPSDTSDPSGSGEPIYSGDTVYYRDSTTYANGNFTQLDRERQALRVLVWTVGNDATNDRFNVQCNIVSEWAAKHPTSGTAGAPGAAGVAPGIVVLSLIASVFSLL